MCSGIEASDAAASRMAASTTSSQWAAGLGVKILSRAASSMDSGWSSMMLHSMMLHSTKMGAMMHEMHAIIEASPRSKSSAEMRRNLLPTITNLTMLKKRNNLLLFS